MLAQDKHEGSGNTDRTASKRQSRRPTKFMFIDSSNGGVNAKPDRVVRSFVMKSARNRKSWSTRPKSPNEGEDVQTIRQKQLPDRTSNQDAPTPTNPWSPQNYRKDSLWDSYAVPSPTSSRSGSVFSTYSSNHTCDSPMSGHTSPFAEYDHADHVHNPPLGRQTVTHGDGFDFGFTKPLNCLSVRLDARMQQLLDQFVEGSAPRLIPVDLHRISSATTTDWIARCITSPHGAPYIYAALTASARAVGLNCEAYKWQAVTEINKLLSDPNTSTDDTTIASVLILLALEESALADPGRQGSDRERSLSANSAHRNGLRTMIGQRGGLAALQTNRCLQVFILMHSIAQCITTFKRPYALLLDRMGQVEDYSMVSGFEASRNDSATSFHLLCSDVALLKILRSLDHFTLDLTNWYDKGRTPRLLDPIDIQKHGCLLMYQLFDWYKTDEASELAGRPASGPTDQSICLGHLVFLVIATEPHAHTFGSRLSKMVSKLRRALQRVPTSQWMIVPDAFLWTLTMGALGAKGLPRSQQTSTSEFSFFAQYSQLSFTLTTEYNGFVTADSLLHRAHRCPWISSVFDAQARRVWAQMGLCLPDIVDMYESSSEEEGVLIDNEHAVGQSTTARFFPASRPGSKKSSPS
ncbi:hypothetical protein C7974DRAFT_49371 [Boeremia exigua]|uniref:uncharacterized protein n=1 Tax=Boeremia exigua TaxID=749465 RepID=UPI001E8CE774|nr:uncharacterized protein C7974DRAFT_49371 [Boeremia exigua]KAH6616653.1 hypothetical protein C7974DRAFT_49371 [Boeremia exigua]